MARLYIRARLQQLIAPIALIAMPSLLATDVSASTPTDLTDSGRITMPPSSVAEIIERSGDSIIALEDVIGVAESICNAQPCLKVLLRRDNAATRAQLPAVMDGVPVVIEISGPVRASPNQ